MIQAIIFDCFGVLYQGSLTAMMQLVPLDRRQEVADANRSFDYGFMTRDEYLRLLSEVTGLSVAQVEAFRAQRHVRNEWLMAEILRLKQTYRIGLLSNVGADSLRGELFNDEELERYFDAMVLSSDEQIAKPNPAIFTLMATRLGVLPEECIMIDDLMNNIDGAARVDMPGIIFSSNDQFARDFDRLITTAQHA